MKQMLNDYGNEQGTMTILCDNSNVINISKNHVLHSHTKYIELRHHFIKDLIEEKVIPLECVPTKHNWQIFSLNHWILLGLNSLEIFGHIPNWLKS